MPNHIVYPGQVTVEYDLDIMNIAKNIDSTINNRLSCGCCETFISSEINVPSFEHLLTAFSAIKNTDHITRSYISHKSKLIVIVLDDSHTIGISMNSVGDATLPIFDVDDGFSLNAFDQGLLEGEFNEMFNTWHLTFLQTNGENWSVSMLE